MVNWSSTQEAMPSSSHVSKIQQRKSGATILNRYVIKCVLGKGAMGEVFEVFDIQSQSPLAMKIVFNQQIGGEEQKEAIRKNFGLTSLLTHPHIGATRFLETDQRSGEMFLLMDLVRGPTLEEWLNGTRPDLGGGLPLPAELALGVGEQMAIALDYAHTQPVPSHSGGTSTSGILHRDLKPANIMIVEGRNFREGVPFIKIVDFGLAAEIQGSIRCLSIQGVRNLVAGTFSYMAPEQWEGRTLTSGVDQWSLAVMLYQMLAGKLPFEAPTWQVLLRLVLDPHPQPPAHMPQQAWEALRKAFHIDRRHRYATCMDLVQAVREGYAATARELEATQVFLGDPTTGLEAELALSVPPEETESEVRGEEPLSVPATSSVSDLTSRARTSKRFAADSGVSRKDPQRDMDFAMALMKVMGQGKKGLWASAERDLEPLAKKYPRDPELYTTHDRLRRELIKTWMGGVEKFRDSESRRPKRWMLTSRLATARARMGDLAGVLGLLGDATIEHGPVVVAQALNAAVHQGITDDVRPHLEKLSALASEIGSGVTSGWVLLDVGRAYATLGDLEAASLVLKRSEASFLRGGEYYQVPPPIMGLEDFLGTSMSLAQRSTRISSTSLRDPHQNALAQVAVAQAESGLPEAAESTLVQIEDSWLSSETRLRLVSALLDAGRPVEADRMAEQIAHRNARARAQCYLAIFMVQRGYKDRANKKMEAIENDQLRAPVLAHMAVSYLLENQFSEAQSLAHKALLLALKSGDANARMDVLLACAKPLFPYAIDATSTGLVLPKPFLDAAEDTADRMPNHEDSFRAYLSLVKACSLVGWISRIKTIGHEEIIRFLGKAINQLRLMSRSETSEAGYSAVGFALGRTHTYELEEELTSALRPSESAFSRLGMLEGLI